MSKFVTETGIERLIGITKKELNGKADTTHTHVLSEIIDLDITAYPKAVDVLAALNEKADKTHTHEISEITNLQTTLDTKVSSSQVLNITTISQAEYDALETKDATTMYVITG